MVHDSEADTGRGWGVWRMSQKCKVDRTECKERWILAWYFFLSILDNEGLAGIRGGGSLVGWSVILIWRWSMIENRVWRYFFGDSVSPPWSRFSMYCIGEGVRRAKAGRSSNCARYWSRERVKRAHVLTWCGLVFFFYYSWQWKWV